MATTQKPTIVTIPKNANNLNINNSAGVTSLTPQA